VIADFALIKSIQNHSDSHHFPPHALDGVHSAPIGQTNCPYFQQAPQNYAPKIPPLKILASASVVVLVVLRVAAEFDDVPPLRMATDFDEVQADDEDACFVDLAECV
jgi:hypothetical protein